MTHVDEIGRRIDQGLGRHDADLVIKGARILNVATGTIEPGDIAICGDWIVGTYDAYRGVREIDGRGLVAVPGFIDTHVHVESSLVTPAEFDRMALVRGTTTAICDPHEMANVLGLEALRYFLDASQTLHMTLKVQLSSCVPATALETSGANLSAADLVSLGDHPAMLGLAEMMNFPGVLAKDPVVLEKLEAFAGRHIDGHIPLVRGYNLNAYLAAGPRTDHETPLREEGAEKLARGLQLLIREGSIAKNVATLAPLLTEATWPCCAFCTDDRNPLEVVEEGHIDFAIRKAIRSGAPVIPTYRAATFGAARAFGLFDRGQIAPGRRADIVLLNDLDSCAVDQVICGGVPSDAAAFEQRQAIAPVGYRSVKRAPVGPEVFAAPTAGPSGPVIGAIENSLLTEHLTMTLPWRDGQRLPDRDQGVHKLAVLERHGVNGNIAVGFVHGFGMLQGALATSVGHDSHNLMVVGNDDADMALAVNRLIELQGGAAAVAGGKVLAELALPIAGLISEKPYEDVVRELRVLRQVTEGMGCAFPEPLLQLAFLPLPVIPHLKLTDRGLVDVDRFELIEA